MNRKRVLIYGIFLVYCLILIDILFFRYAYTGEITKSLFDPMHLASVNLVPFKGVINGILKIKRGKMAIWSGLRNLFAPLLLYIPMGFLIPRIIKGHWHNFLYYIFFLIPMGMEIIQFLTYHGRTDIDDMLLGFMGCCIGAYIGFVKR